MPTSVSNLERAFVLKALTENARTDCRAINTFREITFELNSSQRGSVIASLGDTKVSAVVSAQVIRPYGDRPAEGQVNYFLEFSSLAVPAESLEDYEEEESRLQRLLDRMCKNSRMVDTESLCIVPGEHVWSVRVDIHILNHGGNLIDAIVAATLCALTDYRRPDVSVTEEGIKIHSSFEKHPVPLALHNPVVSVSFGLFDPAKALSDHATYTSNIHMIGINNYRRHIADAVAVADPSLVEELVGCGRLTYGLNRHGEIGMMMKTGGESVNINLIQEDCLHIAKGRAISLLDAINVAILKVRSSK